MPVFKEALESSQTVTCVLDFNLWLVVILYVIGRRMCNQLWWMRIWLHRTHLTAYCRMWKGLITNWYHVYFAAYLCLLSAREHALKDALNCSSADVLNAEYHPSCCLIVLCKLETHYTHVILIDMCVHDLIIFSLYYVPYLVYMCSNS